MKTIALSFISGGNLTRGEYGDVPHPVPVEWDAEQNSFVATDVDLAVALESPTEYTWGAWDADYGYMAPWPADDVVEDDYVDA